MESFDEFSNPYHIVVEFNKTDIGLFQPLTEGKWEPSEEKGYWKRLDTPNFDFEKLHVHIARDKHINTKSKQVSWNDDGTRHDKKSFNNNFVGLETAKRIARNALGLSNDVQLESLSVPDGIMLLNESCIDYLPKSTSIFIFKITKLQILKS